jgi:hypothetical protein
MLFSGPMVRAILEGRKCMTRRVAKGAALEWLKGGFAPASVAGPENGLAPFAAGDLLWVRETWAIDPETERYLYRATDSLTGGATSRWRPSIFMPRAAARLFLRVAGVRLERLQDITEADCYAEGIVKVPMGEGMAWAEETWAVGKFARLWDSINAKRGFGWGANPWVWAVSFTREDAGPPW